MEVRRFSSSPTAAIASMLDIAAPVLLAPMALVSGGALAGALSRAVGLGFIGVGMALDPAKIEAEVELEA